MTFYLNGKLSKL